MEVTTDMYRQLKIFFGYEIVNKEPLERELLENSINTKYGVNIGFDVKLFESIDDREEWILKEKPGIVFRYKYDLLDGVVAGEENVIKETNEAGTIRLISINLNNPYSYHVYDFDESKKRGKYKWNHFIDDYSEKYRLYQNLVEGKDNIKIYKK